MTKDGPRRNKARAEVSSPDCRARPNDRSRKQPHLIPSLSPLLPARRVPSSLVAAAPLRSSDPCAGGHSRTAARAGRNGSSTSPTHILPFLALPSGSRTPPCSRGPSPAARPGARGAASAPRRRLLPRAAGGLQPSAAARGVGCARADPRARQGRPLRPLLQPPRRPGARAVSFVPPSPLLSCRVAFARSFSRGEPLLPRCRRMISYAACLEGADVVRLFDRRISARRGQDSSVSSSRVCFEDQRVDSRAARLEFVAFSRWIWFCCSFSYFGSTTFVQSPGMFSTRRAC